MISPRPMRTSHPSSMHWVFHQLPNLYFRTQHHKSQPPEPPQEPATRYHYPDHESERSHSEGTAPLLPSEPATPR
nr:hypothetical protein Q903MT_gene1968 [Picea sitchensis]